jgi:hypothetical protein
VTARTVTSIAVHGAGERAEYLIDGFRVVFLHQAEWQCACREFGASGTCRHSREAGGMRAAQAQIQRRLLARASDFAPYVRGLSVRRVGAQSHRRGTGPGPGLKACQFPGILLPSA